VAEAEQEGNVKNVVLVHGAFVDGSGWRAVYDHLTKAGFRVTVAQIATRSLADDVATTKRAIAACDGPVVLVGHSYGGVVITEAGTDPRVAALVYVAAFAPDTGESVATLAANPAPGASGLPILPPQAGALFLDRQRFQEAFAADLSDESAAFLADSQTPWGLEAFGGVITEPAWKSRSSWYVVAEEDRMISPDAQRAMSSRAGSSVVEVKASHAVFMSQPAAVAALIRRAAVGAAAIAR